MFTLLARKAHKGHKAHKAHKAHKGHKGTQGAQGHTRAHKGRTRWYRSKASVTWAEAQHMVAGVPPALVPNVLFGRAKGHTTRSKHM